MSASSEGGTGGVPVGGSTATAPSATGSMSASANASASASASASLVSHSHPPLQLRGVINKYSLPSHLPSSAAHSSVAAKITHVKSDGSGGISISGTPILSGGTIKVAAANPVQQTSLGTPIALNAGQATTAASIRAIGAGGQSTQVRVVMPMIKQLENVTATGRTQITAIPAAPARSGANASITVTRPVTQATYLPRASVTATQMGGVGVGVGQRLVTPLRATSSATVTQTAPTVLSSTGGFVRGATASVSRGGVALSAQPPSAVISSSNSAAWMQGPTGQVQLIRAIPQPRQRIITTSACISNASVVTTTPVQAPTALSVSAGQPLTPQQATGPGGGPQAYVATVLPQRQHQATLVYSSNVSAPNVSQNPGQQFNPRFAVATPTGGVTTTTPGGTTVTPRHVRPIPLGKSFPGGKLNTTSISIRAPSIPQLNTSVTASPTPVSVSGGATVAPGRGPGAGGTALTATNLPTTRIIQLQQPATGTTQQIIGSAARLAGNVMLQPFLMSTTAAAKMGIRPPVTMTAKVQPSLTITQLNPIGKLSTAGGAGAPTMAPQGVASIQAVPVPNVSASVVNPSSVAGATSAAGGATVLPLTVSGRGGAVGPGGNILTGTLTPIKNAHGITLGKMMMTPATAAPGGDSSGTSGATVTGFQRTWNPVVASQSQLMKIDEKGSAATIYYESMPASASTGVLSLTTTTVTQSTQAQAQLVSSAGGSSLSVSSLPFGSHAPTGAGSAGTGSQATFTVLPSGAGGAATRTIGHQQLIIPAGPNSAPPQHMVIPLHTSVKVTTGAGNPQQAAGSAALVSSFMRKRDADGSPIRAAKNLGPTLLSMASNTSGPNMTPAPGTTFNIQPVSVAVPQSVGSGLTVEALAKKERERVAHGVASSATSVATTVGTVSTTRTARAESPDSSDGSTTVSANSSPGVDQQLQDRIGDPPVTGGASGRDNSTHFNPITEMYSSHQSMQQNLGLSSLGGRSGSSAFVDVQAPTPQQQQPQQQAPHQLMQQAGTRMNGTGNSSSSSYDCSSRKKPRRSTNDSQHSTQSQASLSLPPPSAEATPPAGASYMQKHNNGGLLVTAATPGVAPNSAPGDANHRSSAPAVTGNKENANPVDFVIRRPRNCALLNTYKPTHKLANNHFHRYADVKPREERRATVIDLANQPNVQGKINGWKIYHLRSQMEDLNESEVFSLGKLETMLQELEKDKEKHSEMERVTELLKGNIQRSKIITDGINEAQNQLMKIFEHKPHVSDIINRCASKRNFKKREKI
ncbi:pneumococcal serine-rich repeat protein isoform X2 [Drosophila gunungcola]|uniref:pneumococcal serine-rich repeat protein isoform X2 n=1 Tax=Drosophila gunungcola TaxID=103775 RepID=UPI0022E3C484|nr:pneumococcal serine-rich repeat protein isoform X2 [Drosophila gunungcola]XP_052845195.1 pneumococcal serine-rich repeat protein isoform X2 [Drosophila gunungcola]